MRIEHIAFNVADPVAMANWYQQHLGFSLGRALADPAMTHFLTDDSGKMMVEIYCNDAALVPDYFQIHPLQWHLALISDQPSRDCERLCHVGAAFFEEVHLPDGSHLIMIRDPWGVPLQLCRRQ